MRFNVSNPWLLYVWINILPFAFCYDQLVNIRSTIVSKSSTFKYRSYSGSADKTIEGNFDQGYTNCMHTDAGRQEAWLQIDLGGIFNLKSVKIWYRQDINRGKDQNTKRLKGVSIFASYEPVVTSYTSTVDKRYQCYKDPGNVTLDTELELNCTRLAQYVTIYNDQMNDENGVFLEICEVEIYGCPRRRYVKDCTPCDTCKAECDVTGRCDMLGCKEGYHPPFCKVCSPGRYGKDCKEVCGYCERNEPCNHITGSCPGLCEPGYYGEKCLTPCTFGRYGEGCKGICGHCESNKTCNYVNGSCSGLCEPGYHGENCLTKCKDGWFGKECKERCGYCRGNKPCHHVTESCSGLCEAGFHGENCENGVSYQILAGVRELLNLMTELISHRRRKSDLKEKGTSPTDFK
ncbi:protein draper-like isoform X2 [Saccostrea cucullata]|uniref:protein draper-like isoform X2 n=1 Tax=Saccostrea cuccullata TaxID=36930 RepID=UPI002ED0D5B2